MTWLLPLVWFTERDTETSINIYITEASCCWVWRVNWYPSWKNVKQRFQCGLLRRTLPFHYILHNLLFRKRKNDGLISVKNSSWNCIPAIEQRNKKRAGPSPWKHFHFHCLLKCHSATVDAKAGQIWARFTRRPWQLHNSKGHEDPTLTGKAMGITMATKKPKARGSRREMPKTNQN